MKKSFMLLLFTVIIAGVSFAAKSITVNSPNGGEKWIRGSIQNITWNGIELTNPVKITLWKNGTLIGLIVKNQPANGSYPWTVGSYQGGTAVYGSDYKIKIREQGGQEFTTEDLSDDNFTIKLKYSLKPQESPLQFIGIKIKKPTSSSFWNGGSKHAIVWENKYTKGKKIKIDLYNFSGKKFIQNIYTRNTIYFKFLNKSKTSKYTWTVPNIGPKKCKIKISVTGKHIKGFSEMFTIRFVTKIKKYKIYGTTYNKVKWRKKGKKSFKHYETPLGDPGPGKMRIGYESFDNDSSSSSYLYRSFVSFNVSKFKGKGLILSAKLHYNVYAKKGNCGMGNGSINLVNEAWGNKMFSCSLTPISSNVELKNSIIKWVAYPKFNFGLVILGNEFGYNYIFGKNTKCYVLAKSVYLEIEFLEKN